MFIDFFYYLKERGLKVSLSEWLTLLTAMKEGLHHNSLMGFYQLCRAIILKDETEFDLFDQAFKDYFRTVLAGDTLPEALGEGRREAVAAAMSALMLDTAGESTMKAEDHPDTMMMQPGSLAAGGRSAIIEIGSRKYRDFRKDNTLSTRNYQMAFRLLKNVSAQSDNSEPVFDIDATIRATGDRGGLLSVEYTKPRRNSIRVLLFIDSGGSMAGHAMLCSRLFQAAQASKHFKELKTYYFHNCIYPVLHTDPAIEMKDGVPLTWLIGKYDEDTRIIIVGDAEMNPAEYYGSQMDWINHQIGPSGEECLRMMKRHFRHMIWLNPEPMPDRRDAWNTTHFDIAGIVKMYELTLEGLERGLKYLLSGK